VLLIFGLNACRTAPIYNARHIPISPRSSATEEEIEKTIWYAGRRLDWRISKVHPGEMQGVYRKRRKGSGPELRNFSFEITGLTLRNNWA